VPWQVGNRHVVSVTRVPAAPAAAAEAAVTVGGRDRGKCDAEFSWLEMGLIRRV